MTLVPVDSSSIKAVGYDTHSEVLQVQFLNGNTYEYQGVGEHEHAALMSAQSIGAHFGKHIRPKFTGDKL
jgi:hypothetical protein